MVGRLEFETDGDGNSPRMRTDPPALSFVLVVGDQRERAGHALGSILRQEGIERAEVLVLDSGARGLPPVAGSDHPAVELLPRGRAARFGELRAEGVRRARGDVVAFLEDHCVLAPGFLRAILEAFQGPWSAAGGKCLNANPGVGESDLMAVTNYGLWMGRMTKGEATFVPGSNSAYRRAALLAYEPDLVPLLTTDMVLQLRLREDGHRFLLDPAARFGHLNEVSLHSAAAAMFHYHRCMGQARAAVLGWSTWRIVRYLVQSTVIPWVRTWRTVRLSIGQIGRSRGWALRRVPTMLILFHGAALGQALGLVFGVGRSPDRLTFYEVHDPRPGYDAAVVE
jgi:hypothetical protein